MPANLTSSPSFPSTIWISWQYHLRTSEICKGLGLELHTLVTSRRGWKRYIALTYRTLILLFSRRPSVLIVQNPSIVLTTLAVLSRPLFRYSLIVDAHNEAISPYNYPSNIIRRVAHWLMAKADLTIVTNRQLSTVVRDAGGAPFVLPDRIPDPPSIATPKPLSNSFNLVLIATFADDEPYAEVFSAVSKLGEKINLYVTGNPQKMHPSLRADLPAHIVFTGFLAEQEYWTLLASAHAIIDLTRMDNCLVCGAYEAVAVERPLILSDNSATREHFFRGVVYTQNTAECILESIEHLLASYDTLAKEISLLKPGLEENWKELSCDLATTLLRLGSSRNGSA